MRHCHDCENRPQPGQAYEETACAKCAMVEEHPGESGHFADPATFESRLAVQHPAYGEDTETSASSRENIDGILKAMAKCLRCFIALKEEDPEVYRLIDAKLENPSLSYSELGRKFGCTKQNIQHHLKRAISLMPELGSALLVDNSHTPATQMPLTRSAVAKGGSLDVLEDPVVIAKLDKPGLSDAELGRKFGLSASQVFRRLAMAKQRAPGLSVKLCARSAPAEELLSDPVVQLKLSREDISCREIAEKLGVSQDYAYQRLYRARLAMPALEKKLRTARPIKDILYYPSVIMALKHPGVSKNEIAAKLGLPSKTVYEQIWKAARRHPELREKLAAKYEGPLVGLRRELVKLKLSEPALTARELAIRLDCTMDQVKRQLETARREYPAQAEHLRLQPNLKKSPPKNHTKGALWKS